jgi:O-antigen/teichoic acid export membrane protein
MNYILNILSTIVKIIAGVVFFVILADVNSVDEFGQLGHILALSSALVLASSLGIQNKLIQDFSTGKKFLDANYIFVCTLFFLFFLFFVLLFSNLYFYEFALKFGVHGRFSFNFSLFLCFVGSAFFQFSLAKINGSREYNKVILINVFGNSVSLLIAFVYLYLLNYVGYQFYIVLVYPVIKILIVFLFSGTFSKDNYPISYVSLNSSISKKVFAEISPFVLMAFSSIILIYGFQTWARDFLEDELPTEYLGYWQVLLKHSEIASLLFTSLASIFLVPQITKRKFKVQIFSSVRFSLILVVLSIPALFFIELFSSYYIDWIFGSEYVPVVKYIKWQMVGDLFKVIAYSFTMIVLCNSWVKLYFFFEIIQYALLVFFFTYFIGGGDASQLSLAYLYSYICFFAMVVLIFKTVSLSKLNRYLA